ncbi:inositol monophosphatase [Halobaculum sp. MBLA0147]|uniref:inositol monophosphatase family protein n=1 Tax=Halobaculum sp. MBLA0147 TaxID=3079934 RepID=UPI0035255286
MTETSGSDVAAELTTARAQTALQAARAGASVAAEHFRSDVAVETKGGDTDVVTVADREAQAAVVETVADAYPDDELVGEEGDLRKDVPDEGPAWVVDPVDGTNNFVRGLRTFATAVAAVVDGEPVAAANVLPAAGDTYVTDGEAVYRDGTPVTVSDVTEPGLGCVVPTVWWPPERRAEYARACEGIVSRFADLRRPGCAQAALGRLAAGSLEGVVTNVECNPWDTVGGVHLVRTAGGRVTNLDGERWRVGDRGLVASNGHLHDEVLAAAREIDAEL